MIELGGRAEDNPHALPAHLEAIVYIVIVHGKALVHAADLIEYLARGQQTRPRDRHHIPGNDSSLEIAGSPAWQLVVQMPGPLETAGDTCMLNQPVGKQ